MGSGDFTTSMLHDVEEGGDDGGDRFEGGGGLPSPLRVHHLPQRLVQDPPPHPSLFVLAKTLTRDWARLRSTGILGLGF